MWKMQGNAHYTDKCFFLKNTAAQDWKHCCGLHWRERPRSWCVLWWRCGQKCRSRSPVQHRWPLTNIKCFRAVVLEQTDEGLKPTTTLSMLDGINVLAILDSEGSDLNRGNLVISQESQELLSKLKAGEFEKPTLPKRKRRCPTTKAARKRVAKKVKQMHAKKNNKNSKTDQEPKAQDKKRSRTEVALEHAESITSADLRKKFSWKNCYLKCYGPVPWARLLEIWETSFPQHDQLVHFAWFGPHDLQSFLHKSRQVLWMQVCILSPQPGRLRRAVSFPI